MVQPNDDARKGLIRDCFADDLGQVCTKCDALTGRCEDDSLLNDNGDPLCEECWKETDHDPT